MVYIVILSRSNREDAEIQFIYAYVPLMYGNVGLS